MMSTKICGQLNLICYIMVKSIFKIPEHHVNLQRNAFDLGNTELFTQSLGQLLPVFVREVNPNEHVRINTELYARTQPLDSSALVQIKQNVDYFFIPYRLLWSRAQQFFPKTDYGTTTVLNPSAPTYVPNIGLGQFYQYLKNEHTGTTHHIDELGYKWSDGAIRLLDMLGYGDFLTPIISGQNPTGSEKINIFRILAYQKVYQDFYRNEVLEKQDLETYNIDRLYETYGNNGNGNLFATSSPDLSPLLKWFGIRYNNLRNDYFTCGRHDFTGASWMSSVVGSPVLPSVSSNLDGHSFSAAGFPSGLQGNLIMYTQSGGSPKGALGFSVSNLRSAYALDKLYDAMSRAKDGCYAHQIQSRFGVTPNLDDYHSRYLGGSDSFVQIGEVIGTSADNLGDIGGKGTSYSQSHSLDYDVKEHGVILGIQSFYIASDYASDGLNRFNAKMTFEDYLQPEFADLGYQPIFGYEINAPLTASNAADSSKVFSYVPRYSEYKTCVNGVHGNFRSGRSLSMWSAPLKPLVTHSDDPGVNYGIDYVKLKTNPNILNSIMAVQFDGSIETDQFICKNSYDCQIIRPISVFGSPYTI